MPNKYIFVKGKMQLNPEYKEAGQSSIPTTVKYPNQALVILSSTNDIAEATNAADAAKIAVSGVLIS